MRKKLFGQRDESGTPGQDAPTVAAQAAPAEAVGHALVRAVSNKPELSQTEREQERRAELHLQQITQAWRVLRHELDVAIDEYYRTGKFASLEALVEEPILGAIKQHLIGLRKQHVVWTQPKRRQTTQPHFEIIEERLPSRKRDEHFRFIIREDFLDFSLVQMWEGPQPVDELRANGQATAIEATVAVLKGNRFRLVALYHRDPTARD